MPSLSSRFSCLPLTLSLAIGLALPAPAANAHDALEVYAIAFSYDGDQIQDWASVGQMHAAQGTVLKVSHSQTSYSGNVAWMTVTMQRRIAAGRWSDVQSSQYLGSRTGQYFFVVAPSDGVYRLYFKSDSASHKFRVWGDVSRWQA